MRIRSIQLHLETESRQIKEYEQLTIPLIDYKNYVNENVTITCI